MQNKVSAVLSHSTPSFLSTVIIFICGFSGLISVYFMQVCATWESELCQFGSPLHIEYLV